MLILDAVAIAGGVRFTFPGESDGGGAVHMNVTLGNAERLISPRNERLVGINFNTADSIDKFN